MTRRTVDQRKEKAEEGGIEKCESRPERGINRGEKRGRHVGFGDGTLECERHIGLAGKRKNLRM
jgi:hypothetical protein